ncbi:neutrophil defensin 6-like [Loxodonta africana]|uniref:neutrophil defensin 6-like n=1 Tax=Loxodonta africana TaxID=9785 RepID=UPI0030D463A1
MRTLALLAAILLLALQAQADPLRQADDEAPAQDEPETGDQDMAVSFAGDERSVQEASGLKKTTTCYCRSVRCFRFERLLGRCTIQGVVSLFCCR